MYLFHKYWGRKAHNVVSHYIATYSDKNNLVLDPFCGSGVSIAESLFLNRRAIGIDLNPFSIFLSRNTLLPVSIKKLKELSEKIITDLSELEKDLYGIRCPICGSIKAKITHVIYNNKSNVENSEQEDEFLNNEKKKKTNKTDKLRKENKSVVLNESNIDEIRFSCEKCKISNKILDPIKNIEIFNFENQRINKINKDFLRLLERYQLKIPKLFFKYNTDRKFRQLRHSLIKNPSMEELFTKRNLILLAAIKKKILNLKEATNLNQNDTNLLNLSALENDKCIQEGDLLIQSLFICFSSLIGQSSKMVWVISNRNNKKLIKSQVGSWTHHFFWDPNRYFEINPLITFETRIKKLIAAKKNLAERISNSGQNIDDFISKIKIVSNLSNKKYNFNDILKDSDLALLINASSEKIPLPNESVDYIFTDPPYGDSIQYYELLSLWNAWLDLDDLSKAKNEIIINPKQNKDAESYKKQLTKVFSECFRVLKAGHYMHITFHNTDLNIRNLLVNAVKESGFELEQIIFQMPPRNSLKSYLHYSKSPVGDYFIRFFKPSKEKVKQSKNRSHLYIDNSETPIAKVIENRIFEILKSRIQPTNLVLIYNLIDEMLADLGLFPLKQPKIVDNTIKNLISKNIVYISPDNKIWFTKSYIKSINMNIIKDNSLNSKIKLFLIENMDKIKDKKKKNSNIQDYEIYNMVYSKFSGIYTPDRQEISNILRELGLKKRN